MKIGVALSGSGVGAAFAHVFADELRACAVPIDMISVTSLTAVPILLWSKGVPRAEIDQWMHEIQQNPEQGYEKLTQSDLLEKPCDYSLAVSSVDLSSGVTILYTDRLQADAWNLKALPLSGNEGQALLSSVSPYGGMEPLDMDKMKLCDFTVRYGCPFFPLKMAGIERILSISFAGGNMPLQTAGDNMAALTGRNADLHFTIEPESPKYAVAYIRSLVRNNLGMIYQKLLF